MKGGKFHIGNLLVSYTKLFSAMEYHTVVLDIKKFQNWINLMKNVERRFSTSEFCRRIGYGKSYVSRLINIPKYDIEISARFIGTVMKTFGIEFNTLFTIVYSSDNGNHQQEKANRMSYDAITVFHRRKGLPDSKEWYAR